MAAQFSSVAALGMATLAKTLDSKPIINLTVNDYLYGYEDPILTLGSTFVPSITPFEKFGFLDQFIDIETTHQVVTTSLHEVYKEDLRVVEAVSQTQSTIIDVEYDDDVTLHSTVDDRIQPVVNQMSNLRELKQRDHTIDLWNGSPLMPDWEDHGVNNKNKYDSNAISYCQ